MFSFKQLLGEYRKGSRFVVICYKEELGLKGAFFEKYTDVVKAYPDILHDPDARTYSIIDDMASLLAGLAGAGISEEGEPHMSIDMDSLPEYGLLQEQQVTIGELVTLCVLINSRHPVKV